MASPFFLFLVASLGWEPAKSWCLAVSRSWTQLLSFRLICLVGETIWGVAESTLIGVHGWAVLSIMLPIIIKGAKANCPKKMDRSVRVLSYAPSHSPQGQDEGLNAFNFKFMFFWELYGKTISSPGKHINKIFSSFGCLIEFLWWWNVPWSTLINMALTHVTTTEHVKLVSATEWIFFLTTWDEWLLFWML